MNARRGWREAMVLIAGALALTIVMTFPLVLKLDRAGRTDSGDGMWNLWVVSWVARTLVLDPERVYDANIFYPHRKVLAWSENNLGNGLLAIPSYWVTRNPFVALNMVVLFAFTATCTSTYYLVRHLTGNRPAAAIAAIGFAFCPYMFARMANFHLLQTAGLPLGLLALHRLVEKQTVARTIALPLVLVAQALCAGYYGIFASLIVGLGVFYYAFSRDLWRNKFYWLSVTAAALLAVALISPILIQHIRFQHATGHVRTLDDARLYSANGWAYLSSSSWAHGWLWRWGVLPKGNEVLFPGFIMTALGLTGVWVGLRRPEETARSTEDVQGQSPPPVRETVTFYALVGALAFWGSFGPSGGLYSVLYRLLPAMSFLRAPARFGIVVSLAMAVLGGVAVAHVLRNKTRRARTVLLIFALPLILELLHVPIFFRESAPVVQAYRTLATLPRGPVVEFPFYHAPLSLHHHTRYMLNSTSHWYPLINGYSDYIPSDFWELASRLTTFPSDVSLEALKSRRARYAVIHLNLYDSRHRAEVITGLERYRTYLKPLVREDNVWLYEIVGFP